MDKIYEIGSLFAILTFFHFVFDWFFQSSKTAMLKHKNVLLRIKHCIEYTSLFIVLFYCLKLPHIELSAFVLFVSHYIIDSYYPTYLFFKYIRQPYPELSINEFTFEKMKEYVTTPVGAILMITIDQLYHLAVLLGICYFIA